MEKRFQYFAFISYSRKDEKWAKWLQNKLESYKLPSIIRKEAGSHIPKHVRPVFRDKTDIGIGSLTLSLHQELEDSKCLIVVCSPNSAQSEWVNREVEAFQQLGRGEKVIPFIVEGSPDARDTEQKCYPPSLSAETLGSSIDELGRDKAFIKVVAAILGLKFDQLWNRHNRLERRKKMMRWGIASCLFLAIFIGGYLSWDYYVPKNKYYADYVDRWGLPGGIIELSQQDFSRPLGFYRFQYQKGMLRSIIHLNAANIPMDHFIEEHRKRPVIQKFYYDEQTGKLTRVEFLNKNQNVVQIRLISGNNNEIVDIRNPKGWSDALEANSVETPDMNLYGQDPSNENTKSKISRLVLTRNDKGEIVGEKYMLDNWNTPQPDVNGIYGVAYNLDSLGRKCQLTYLDRNGNRIPDKRGVSQIKYNYSKDGFFKEISYFDNNDSLILNSDNYARVVLEHTGNSLMTEYYYNKNNQLDYRQGKMAIIRYNFSPEGFLNQIAYFDVDTMPVLNTDPVHKIMLSNDKYGHVNQIKYFDTHDSLMSIQGSGYYYWKAVYDERGDVIEKRYCGKDGSLVLNSEGVAVDSLKYTGYGNLAEVIHYNTELKRCKNRDGFSKMVRLFNNDNYCISESYYDEKDSLTSYQNLFAIKTYEYDNRGNLIKKSFFSENKTPSIIKMGYASVVLLYDETGNKVRQEHYNVNGKLCKDTYGVAALNIKYDKRGNKTEYKYFDEENKPCNNLNGICSYSAEYNERGEILKASYFDEKEKPCLFKNSYHTVTIDYDKYGNRLSETFYDLNNNQSYSSRATYTTNGKVSTVSYFGKNGIPVLNKNGIHLIKNKYDDRLNKVEESFYNTQESITLSIYGTACNKYEYDNKGQLIYTSFYDIKDKAVALENGVAKIMYSYNEYGKKVKEEYYNLNGNKIDPGKENITKSANVSVAIPVIQKVFEGYTGEKAGMKANTIVLKYCNWDVRTNQSFELNNIIQQNKDKTKEIITIDGNGNFHKYVLPEGIIGVLFGYPTIDWNTRSSIVNAYNKWKMQN